jgi:hypothetical protein
MMLQTSTLRITPEMLSLVAEIDELKGAWRALGTLAPERLSALRRIATIESEAVKRKRTARRSYRWSPTAPGWQKALRPVMRPCPAVVIRDSTKWNTASNQVADR